MDYKNEYQEIIERARQFEDGQRERTRILEEAIQLAQRYQDTELEFEAKLDLMVATAKTGEVDKALSTFPWLLNYIDEQEKSGETKTPSNLRFFFLSPKRHVLWMYKWVVSDLVFYPNISMERINAALADMEKRYTESGYGSKTVLEYQLVIARGTGQKEEVPQLLEKLKGAEDHSSMSDCSTCVRQDEAETFRFLGEYDKALKHVRPILNGEESCSSKPYATYGFAFEIYLQQGKTEEAKEMFERMYEKFQEPKNRENGNRRVALYYTLAHQFDQGLAYFEEFLPQLMNEVEQNGPYNSYLVGWRLFDEMEKAGQAKATIKLPEAHPLHARGPEYPVSVLRDWFKNETLSLAEQFNKRNGNEYFSEKIDRIFGYPTIE